ncbi:MAG: AAA family ATPase [Thermoanaerobaculia bacterium]|nr:AAA family ATPase [Thermoanaerobaculia bacterium]
MTLPMRPAEMCDELRRTVLGQDEATREIAVAIVKHISGQGGDNILLVGNSGSGKTTLMRAVEHTLRGRPELARFSNVIRINANVLAEEREGYGRSVLNRLYANAMKTLGPQAPLEELLRWVERGIVFIDEVDKIRASVGNDANVKGIVAQEALLTLMENENVEFEIDAPEKRTVAINSAAILFVAGGAFEEMYDSVYRRAVLGTDVAPLRPVSVVSETGVIREEMPFHLRDYMKYEDLFRYGMTPQFVSRFESIVVLRDLREEDLARIFVEPEGSVFRRSRAWFVQFGLDLQITRGAMKMIAWEAARQKRLGARALKEVWRRVIRDAEFDPSSATPAKGPDGRAVLTVDEAMVKRGLGH